MKKSVLLVLALLAAQNVWAVEKKAYVCDVSLDRPAPESGVGDLEDVELVNSAENPFLFTGEVSVEGEAKAFIYVDTQPREGFYSVTSKNFGSKIKVNLAGRTIEAASEHTDVTPSLVFQKRNQQGQTIELTVQCRTQQEQNKIGNLIRETLDNR